MTVRLVFLILLPVLILLCGAGGGVLLVLTRREVQTRAPERVPPLVRTHDVQREPVRLVVRSEGTVRPRTESTLVPEVSGVVKVTSPSWAEGGFFDEGDLLLDIDSRDYELALVQARAQVAQAELRLETEEEEATVAREEWESQDRTGEPSALLLRTPQLAEAKAALAAARAAEQRAELDLERTSLRAPYAGRVLTKSVDVGQYVTRGTPVAAIYAVDRAEVRLPVPDDEFAFLDLPLDFRDDPEDPRGPPVVLRAWFAGELHAWKGRVTRTGAEIDSRSRMVHVVATVVDPYGRQTSPPTADRPPLAVGLFVEAEIDGRLLEDVVLVPRHALRDAPAGDSPNSTIPLNGDVVTPRSVRQVRSVLIVDEKHQLRSRPVEILRGTSGKARRPRSGERVNGVVVVKGLRDGDRLCLSPPDVVTEGMTVRVEENDA